MNEVGSVCVCKAALQMLLVIKKLRRASGTSALSTTFMSRLFRVSHPKSSSNICLLCSTTNTVNNSTCILPWHHPPRCYTSSEPHFSNKCCPYDPVGEKIHLSELKSILLGLNYSKSRSKRLNRETGEKMDERKDRRMELIKGKR